MIEQANVLTPWARDNGENVPAIWLDYPMNMEDITGQVSVPTNPNSYILHIEAETDIMDAIEDNPDYIILAGTRGPV